MAALFYKDFLIIAIGQFDEDTELWMPVADVSWQSAIGREAHTIKSSLECFQAKETAETFALEAAKAWVDAQTRAA